MDGEGIGNRAAQIVDDSDRAPQTAEAWRCLAHGASAAILPTWCDAGVQVVWRVIDLLPQAVFLVDRGGRFHRANRVAAHLLEHAGPFEIGHGKLTARDGGTPRLHQIIATGAADGTHSTLLALGRAAWPLAMLVVNLGSPDDPDAPIAVVCQPLASRRAPSAETIASAYGLSRAEGRVAALLAQGLSPQDIGDRLGRSLATVRTHLQRVYAKTYTDGQAELVQLVLTGPGMMGAIPARQPPKGRRGKIL